MKASEFIALLQQAIDEYGDLDFVVDDDVSRCFYNSPSGVDVAYVSKSKNPPPYGGDFEKARNDGNDIMVIRITM